MSGSVAHPLLSAFVAAGVSDRRLAHHYGVCATTIIKWRREEGLPSGRKARGRLHGTLSRYVAGCRCPLCRSAKAESRLAAKRREPVEHGISGYTWFGCRCDVCEYAIRQYRELCPSSYVGNRPESRERARTMNERAKAENDQSKREAFKYRYQWTSAEMDLVVSHKHSDKELAAILGRTIAAVRKMRYRATRDPRLNTHLEG